MNENRSTHAQKNALDSAVNEGKITPEQLVEEIYILLDDYFLADFEKHGNTIDCNMKNGQKFKIEIHEK